ncbi:DUF4352 domain-containing protein [Kitasatospora sp. NA04385]|uniref:DUF4352 domain-containing protein n=1 Tax=Kitasatospora sp. NA04385 TaxID=2742135 RepID=UPI00159103A2|nr:DUF4352 domain-containing protein [Kitasatospora sp. NA04385]QKW18047.1 DUF4352 domain-containing protein [Kitasatospora sp. NA04385]
MRRVATLLASSLLVTACTSTAHVTTTPNSPTTVASDPDVPTSSPSASASASTSTSASSSASVSPSASAATASVGSTIALKGMNDGEACDVTVVKVVDPAKPKDQYSSPEAGTRFVAVQFRLANTGTASYSDSPGNGAQVVDTEGQRFTDTYQETAAGPSFSGSVAIAPGDSALGFVTFEVPASSRVAKVQFSLNSGLADSIGQWTVS